MKIIRDVFIGLGLVSAVLALVALMSGDLIAAGLACAAAGGYALGAFAADGLAKER